MPALREGRIAPLSDRAAQIPSGEAAGIGLQTPDGVGLDEDVKPGMVGVPGACCPWFPMEGESPTSCGSEATLPHHAGSGGEPLAPSRRCTPSEGPNSGAPPIRYAWPRVMAKKSRKQKQRATTRRPGPSAAPPSATAPTGVAVEAEDLQPATRAAGPLAAIAQFHLHPRTAVTAVVLGVYRGDRNRQGSILASSPRRWPPAPGIEAGSRDRQYPAHQRHRETVNLPRVGGHPG